MTSIRNNSSLKCGAQSCMIFSLICTGSCFNAHIYYIRYFIPYMESHNWVNVQNLTSCEFPNEVFATSTQLAGKSRFDKPFPRGNHSNQKSRNLKLIESFCNLPGKCYLNWYNLAECEGINR